MLQQEQGRRSKFFLDYSNIILCIVLKNFFFFQVMWFRRIFVALHKPQWKVGRIPWADSTGFLFHSSLIHYLVYQLIFFLVFIIISLGPSIFTEFSVFCTSWAVPFDVVKKYYQLRFGKENHPSSSKPSRFECGRSSTFPLSDPQVSPGSLIHFRKDETLWGNTTILR